MVYQTPLESAGRSPYIPKAYLKVPGALWAILGVLSLFVAKSANPLLTLEGLWLIPIFIMLLWRRDEPPVLFFAISMQWLAVFIKVFHADLKGVIVSELSDNSQEEMAAAIQYSYAGLLVVALGMRCALTRLRPLDMKVLREQVKCLLPRKIFIGYCVSVAAGLFLLPRFQGNVRQISIALESFKWIFYFLLAYFVFYSKNKTYRIVLAGMVLFEIGLGASGFFSDFKTPILVLALAYLTAGYRFGFKSTLTIMALAFLALWMGLYWTAVKTEYRGYLSGDAGGQVVNVPFQERMTSLYRRCQDVKKEDLDEAVDAMLDRIAYVDYFSVILTRVPSVLPYEGGGILMGALKHVFMPRFLFPNKPVINDSLKVMKYTGDNVPEGTSISIGYMPDCYIDFGMPVMYVPIFCIGLLFGSIYRYFISAKSKLYGFLIAVVTLFRASEFGADLIKLLGGTLSITLVFVVINYFLIPPLNRALSKRKA